VFSPPVGQSSKYRGDALQNECGACHGADGKGNTGAGKALGVHDFTSETIQKITDAELAGIISNGKNKMPAYSKSLKDSDIKSLVAYVRELQKK
jgi:cytochrome c6